eukprot:CAMPEP_0181209934 /NCGR_PEP_ID=MMETSP1096-20121128/22953_1 /TAXON_ID=156174 ORGANISM="Chrysochromulina ericina, Strain CCMP281" /NCGR_SAMPLE_ID=MMETSP1096 /ASSEMBLY_ACC=CAM_ASM_000453 /LENGTH=59 /DNA_ID=CAMNT_0023301173 /DNA_START=244 /DNA_END=423 /DNA_ORIENTATION=-
MSLPTFPRVLETLAEAHAEKRDLRELAPSQRVLQSLEAEWAGTAAMEGHSSSRAARRDL